MRSVTRWTGRFASGWLGVATLSLGFTYACNDPSGPLKSIDRLIVISGTIDGLLLQIDGSTGEIRSLDLGLPPQGCGAAAHRSAPEVFTGRRSYGETEYSIFKIDAASGEVRASVGFDDLARAAGVDVVELQLECPMALVDDRLFLSFARNEDGHVLLVLDADDLSPVDVLAPVRVAPFSLIPSGPLADAPRGALLVQGFPYDSVGQPIPGTGRFVAFDLASGHRLTDLDFDYQAPYGSTAGVVEDAGGRLYFVAYPSLVAVDLNEPGRITETPAAAPGPLTLGDGVILQASTGITVEQPGPGRVFVYDLRSSELADSIDVWAPSSSWPPFMWELGTDSTGERLYVHSGTGEGGLYYDTQRSRILVVDVPSRSLVQEIPLGVWPAGNMLLFF